MPLQDTLYYRIVDGRLEAVDEQQLAAPGPRVCYIDLADAERLSAALGFNAKRLTDYAAEEPRFRNSIDVYDDLSVGLMNIINVADVEGPMDRIGFLITKDAFVLIKIVDLDDSVRDMFLQNVSRFQNSATMEKFIYGILERLLVGSRRMLEDMERDIMAIEQRLADDNADRALNRVIYAYRKRLSTARNYYEQLIDIGEELMENENDLFSEQGLWYFRVFVGKAERISGSIQLMSENVVHLRESLEAVVNYNLNRIMKVFTVVTSIFLPLTLIVGWYGMNFKMMPELEWEFGYFFVIGLSVLVVVANIVYFRKKKLM